MTIALSPDGRLLTSRSGEVMNLESGDRTQIDIGSPTTRIGQGTFGRINQLRFSPDGDRLIVAVTNFVGESNPGLIESRVVQFFDLVSGQMMFEFEVDEERALRLSFAADGKSFVYCAARKKTSRRDAETGELIGDYGPAMSSHVVSVDDSADGKYVAAVERDGVVRIWQAENGKLIHEIDVEKTQEPNFNHLACAKFSPDGRRLAVGGLVGVWILDPKSGEKVVRFRGGRELSWSHDANRIHCVTSVGVREREGDAFDTYPTVEVWDAETGKLIQEFDSSRPQEIVSASLRSLQ